MIRFSGILEETTEIKFGIGCDFVLSTSTLYIFIFIFKYKYINLISEYIYCFSVDFSLFLVRFYNISFLALSLSFSFPFTLWKGEGKLWVGGGVDATLWEPVYQLNEYKIHSMH